MRVSSPSQGALHYLGAMVFEAATPDGTVAAEHDYYPFGQRITAGPATTMTTALRHTFSGKEDQGHTPARAPYLDFGARLYSPSAPRWLSVDPMAEKYFSISPYAYCAGNPINMVDPEGESTFVYMIANGQYCVSDVGNPFDGDDNIYLGYYDEDNNWVTDYVSIGKSATPFSFYNTKTNNWAAGAIIDVADFSGIRFLSEHMAYLLPLGEYMVNAGNSTANHFQLFDFKITNGDPSYFSDIKNDAYRGMPFKFGKQNIYASARDIGNILAGYYAGANGFSWLLSRIAFDMYQLGIECHSTQVAEHLGWTIGHSRNDKFSNFIKSIPSLKDGIKAITRK